jgi:hypothetical protein
VTAPEIRVAMTAGRSGFVVAVMPAADLWSAREVLLVGSVRQGGGFSEPDRPEDFTAWLWPAPGWHPARGQHAEAVKAPDEKTLAKRLQGRLGKDGPWWARGASALPGPLPEMGPGLAGELRDLEERLLGAEPGERIEED